MNNKTKQNGKLKIHRKLRKGGGMKLTLVAHKRQAPFKHVHKVWKMVWVWRAVELTDVHEVVVVLEDGTLVCVNVAVVGSREQGDDGGEVCGVSLAVHLVPINLSFMCALG